jgi:hypothetical protein
MLDLAKFYPPIMQVAGPQIIRAMDWPDKDIIAKQLEKSMPEALRPPDPNAPPMPPEMQQAQAQAQQMIQQLTQALNAANDKTAFERMKQEYATFRTQLQQETALATAELKNKSAESVQLNRELFAELRGLRAALEPKLFTGPGQSPQPGTGTPPDGVPPTNSPQGAPPQGGPAAPDSSAPPVNVPGEAGNTPGEVGIPSA